MVKKEFKSGYGVGDTYKVYNVGDSVMGYNSFSPIVYNLGIDGAKPRYKFSVEGFSFPDAEFLNKISDNGTKCYFTDLENSDRISYYAFYETTDLIALNFIFQKDRYIGFFNKKNGETAFYTENQLAKSLGLGEITYFVSISLNDKIAALIEPGTILDAIANGEQINPQLKEIA